jgi:hypothetical protein
MRHIKISLISDMGYKPISTAIQVKSIADYNENKARYDEQAILRICAIKRGMTIRDLKKYGYNKIKAEIIREV